MCTLGVVTAEMLAPVSIDCAAAPLLHSIRTVPGFLSLNAESSE